MSLLASINIQEIVNKMMEDIPYNINIMDETGTIIGSGEKDRIGDLHRGAREAISSGEMVTIYEETATEKRGTNDPILLGERIIGVVGITGNPLEVIPFCKLVNSTVVLMISSYLKMQDEFRVKDSKKYFFNRILLSHDENNKRIEELAPRFNINLEQAFNLIIFELGAYVKSSVLEKCLDGVSIYRYATLQYVIITNDKNDDIIERLKKRQDVTRIYVGKQAENAAQSFEDLKRLISVFHALGYHDRLLKQADYHDLDLLATMITTAKTETLNPIDTLADDLLIETLQSFIRYNGSINEIADDLMVHRNTLQYRLNRITESTGLNPRYTVDLFRLFAALVNWQAKRDVYNVDMN